MSMKSTYLSRFSGETSRGDVELAKAFAQTLFELFLADGQDACPGVDGLGLDGGEEADGLARVVEDEVLKVLVVAHGEWSAGKQNVAPGPAFAADAVAVVGRADLERGAGRPRALAHQRLRSSPRVPPPMRMRR
jgi:hypothetical protein